MLPRFYPIVDSADWVARLLPWGVKLVQLRIKDKSVAVVRAEIARARDLARAAGALMVVNDYWELALDLGCDWLHLGQEDLATADLAAIRRGGLKLGLSSHSPEELDHALAANPDYVALGPIYPTLLKVMPWAPQGLTRIGDWKRRLGTTPLVAIGGLTVERAAGVIDAGADSLAVVTDVVLAADPAARVAQWLAITA